MHPSSASPGQEAYGEPPSSLPPRATAGARGRHRAGGTRTPDRSGLARLLDRGGTVRTVTLLGGSTALAQLLLVASTPLVTRLYTPAAIGLFTLYFTYVTFVQTGSSLMYSAAIPTAQTEPEARSLTWLSLLLTVPYAGLGAAIFLLLRQLGLLGFGAFPLFGVILAALSLALTGAFTTFRYHLVRQQEYGGIARALLAQNGVRAAGQVGGGYAFGAWWMMALADLGGRLFGILPGLRSLRRKAGTGKMPTAPSVARRYRSFPLVYLPSVLIDNLVVWLPLPLITAHYGLTAGGFFAIVTRVIGVPLGVIATSVADIFHGNVAQAARTGRSSHRLFWRTTGLLAAMGTPLALILFFSSRPILSTILGHQWATAGTLCSLMAPWFLLQFVVSPLSRVVLVYQAQHLKLVYDLSALAAIGTVYTLAIAHRASLDHFVGWLSASAAVVYVVYFLLLIRIVETRGTGTCVV